MDKTTDTEDKHDKGNKRKSNHRSVLPANFPWYQLPILQSLNDGSSGFGLDWYKEEQEPQHLREIEDWNDPIARELEELLLSNLRALFHGAIRQIADFGYSEDVAELALSRKALYTEEGDPISTIVHEALDVLKGKDVANADILFENFQHLLHYTMVEMISVLREVRPSLTVGEAMWVLLICDLNISLACATEGRLSGVVCKEESSADSSIPQSKSEVQSCSPTLQEESSPNHQNHKSEAPKFGCFLNSTNNQSPLASEGVKKKAESATFSVTAGKCSGTHECKSGSCSKRHNRKEIAALRQKFLHMEKAYRACGKGAFKSGRITSVSGLVVEKRLKSPSEIPNQQMKCGSSNTTGTKVRSADVACCVSTNDASTLPASGSSGTISSKDAVSASANTNTSTLGSTLKPKSEQSGVDTKKIMDYCANIPFDEALGKYVPRNAKEELTLKLISRLQELQDQIESWNNWASQKVKQVAQRLTDLQAEFKTLRKEKEEAELFKKDKKVLEENAEKRITEMENAMENTKKQIESAASATLMLEEESSLLKNELGAAKMWVVKSMASYQQALEREKMALKQVQAWESQKGSLRDEFEREKHKLSNLQQELEKEKNLQAKFEARLEKERVAIEKVLAQAAVNRKGREQLEARIKSEEDKVRKKAASDLQNYVEDIAKLEKELIELKLESDSEKIAALRRCIDERNGCLSRTIKSAPTVIENKKSNSSHVMVSCEDELAAGSLKRERECVMCLSEEMSVVFLPCAHQVVCPECNELHEKQGMKDCPSCRTLIQRRIHARFTRH